MHPYNDRPDRSRKPAWLPAALLAAVLAAGSFVPDARAAPFDEAHLFFELNNTDGDLGIHSLVDGDAYDELEIIGPPPGKEVLLTVIATGSVQMQGLTELFFESAEPTFDELDPADFFNRFPEGKYTFEAKSLDGPNLKTSTDLTHVMPAPPVTFVNGDPSADGCDEPLPVMSDEIVISWNAVTMSHPEADGGGAGVQPPVPVTIINYEVVVEIDETPFRDSIILPPDQFSYEVPSEILALGDEIKFEVLAREESFNQTAVESCFEHVE